MFLDNKYNKWYFRLVLDRKNRGLVKQPFYTEKHHIIPRCMGGSDSASNLVRLTAREHYIVHWLLTKCSIALYKHSIASAFFIMTNSTSSLQKRNFTSHHFERARSVLAQERSKAYKGIKRSQYKLTEEGLAKKQEAGRKTAQYLKDNLDIELNRRKSISDTMSGRMPSKNSLANLRTENSMIRRKESAINMIRHRQIKQGKRLMFNDEVCFLCYRDAAECYGLSIRQVAYKSKANKDGWVQI